MTKSNLSLAGWVRRYAPTQPDIVACSKLLNLCDAHDELLTALARVADAYEGAILQYEGFASAEGSRVLHEARLVLEKSDGRSAV